MRPLVAAIEREALGLDPNVPAIAVATQSDAISAMLALGADAGRVEQRLRRCSRSASPCVGLYGTMAYAVARRTREIGVRIALGARARVIQRMILRETVLMVVAGPGPPACRWRWPPDASCGRQLFDLSPYDPVTMAAATLAVLAVTIVAGFIPARRAARVDAMVALRCE